jgi:uncharacterized RDD family membrane protein YckC
MESNVGAKHVFVCPNCLGENTANALFCGYCGYTFYARSSSVKYPTFLRRVGAAFIDGILLHIIANILLPIAFVILVKMTNGPSLSTFRELVDRGPEFFPETLANLILMLYVTCFAVSEYFYSTLLDCSKWQGTVGKRILGMKVTDLDGNRIGFFRANKRSLARFLSRPGYVGFFLALLTEKKQTLHDYLTKCVVVKR